MYKFNCWIVQQLAWQTIEDATGACDLAEAQESTRYIQVMMTPLDVRRLKIIRTDKNRGCPHMLQGKAPREPKAT